MNFRTDLAVEAAEILNGDNQSIDYSEKQKGKSKVISMLIKDYEASEKIGKPQGKYITVEVPALTDYFQSTDERIKVIAEEIKSLIPKKGPVLVAGLGNLNITPDALGPKAAKNILATRHIKGEMAKSLGLENLRDVSVISPGVLGQTGIEVSELLSGLTENLRPCCVIVIDAIASRKLSRLGCTVQISDTGISPGAGVGNHRPSINKETLGVPVIGIGVPTVVDAATLALDIVSNSDEELMESLSDIISPRGEMMVVTPKEIDLLTDRASLLIGMAINCALHPDFEPDDLYSLVS